MDADSPHRADSSPFLPLPRVREMLGVIHPRKMLAAALVVLALLAVFYTWKAWSYGWDWGWPKTWACTYGSGLNFLCSDQGILDARNRRIANIQRVYENV